MRGVQGVTWRSPSIRHSMSCWSNGMLCTTLPCTLSWMVALTCHGSVDRTGTRAKARLRLMTFGSTTSSSTTGAILLGIVVGLGVAPVLELGGVGIEAHELVEDPVVHRELDDTSGPRCPCAALAPGRDPAPR